MSSTAPEDRHASVMMTLAGIAYGEPSAIAQYLDMPTVCSGEYAALWVPGVQAEPVNFAFIAQHRVSGNVVLAIRGTYPDPFSRAYWADGNLDKPFGKMHEWPGSRVRSAKVSDGTWRAFNGLLGLSDGRRTLVDVVKALPAGTDMYVTGHSLGGTLAPVLALWLSEQRPEQVMSVYAFAGMTPGNRAFARLFDSPSPLAGRVWRYNNRLDTVPYGWDRVWATRRFYQPEPRGGFPVWLVLLIMRLRLLAYGFASIGTEKALGPEIIPTAVDKGLIAYLLENLSQHLPGTYVSLLGAPKLPFSLEYGSVVVDSTRDAFPGADAAGHLAHDGPPRLRRRTFYMGGSPRGAAPGTSTP